MAASSSTVAALSSEKKKVAWPQLVVAFSWSVAAFFVAASSFSMRIEAFLSCLLKLFSPSVGTYTRPVEAFFHVRLHQFVAVAVAGRGLPHI